MRPLGIEPFQEFTLRGLFRVDFHPGSQPHKVRTRTIGFLEQRSPIGTGNDGQPTGGGTTTRLAAN
jgi:hypothetical protein